MSAHLFGDHVYTSAAVLRANEKVSPRKARRIKWPDDVAEGEPFFLVHYNNRAVGDPKGNPEINADLDDLLITYMRAGFIESIERFEFDGASYALAGRADSRGSSPPKVRKNRS